MDVWWFKESGNSHEGVDEEDLEVYRSCILFIKQWWREVSMQQM
jgi:hypothetical protein